MPDIPPPVTPISFDMKNNRFAQFLLIVFGVLLLISIYVPFHYYSLKYDLTKISNKQEDWNLFSAFMGGVLGPIIAFWALVITAWIAYEFNSYQKTQKKNADQAQAEH